MTSVLTTRNETDTVSAMMKFFMVIMVAVVMADMIARFASSSLSNQYIASQMYQGISDPRVVEATDEPTFIDLVGGHPYTPWVSANFINDGPNSVWMAINHPNAIYELRTDESATVYRIGAQERIETIFFYCSTDEEASIRVIGEY